MPRYSIGTFLAITTLLVFTFSVHKSSSGELLNLYQLGAMLVASIVSGLLGWTTSSEILYQYRRAVAASGLTFLHLGCVAIVSTLHQKSTLAHERSSPMDPIVFVLGWDFFCFSLSALCIYGILWIVNIPNHESIEPTVEKTSGRGDTP